MEKNTIDCLIIDDDPGICRVLKAYCENLGVFRNIIVANDGVAGCNKLRNQKFGLVLLDINMPKKNGIDVLLDFGKDHLNGFDDVVIVSGELDKDKITAIMSAGIKSFLIKPFTEAQFQEKVLPIIKKNLQVTKSK
ncbi:response regulator [Halobacteriovorax sp. JY17]|uniref:response regulator n=1 Tax=Halobacteriovorax sp. JY17 TaxID=2014617 RepID=UPI000C36E885|nr:response regulator [Halobacteriovorax sp. JY17]PIK15540.1 MAG: two-component system response regulator [Halobacteriovorax sp. JY17]